MPIMGRLNVLRAADRQRLEELSGVRGFDGELEHGFFVRAPAHQPDVHGAAMYIDAARLQQRLTDHGAKHWAAVHSTAIGDAGPYVVMTYFPHSAASIRAARGHLTRRMLYHIMRAVVNGLGELRRHADRAHGNLKASNILLSDDQVTAGTWIVLSDPAPPHSLVRLGDDATQLGRLLFELVCGREYDGQWPVEASPDWSRVGGGWRALCNRLLHPETKRRQAALRSLGTHVGRLRPHRVLVRALVMLTLISLALGGAYAGWKERGRWASPPRTPLTDTWSMAQDDVEEPAEEPGASAAPSIVANVRRHAAQFRRYGWNGPAAYLEGLNERFTQSSQARKQVDELLEEIGQADQALRRIDELTDRIRANRRALSAAKDPLLESYRTFANEGIGQAVGDSSSLSLTALASALGRIAEDRHWGAVIAYVRQDEYAQLDQEYFLENSGIHRTFASSGKPVADAQDLRAWLESARSGRFASLDPAADPRLAWTTPKRIERLSGQELKRLSSLLPPETRKEVLAGYQSRLSALEAHAGSLAAAQLPWKNRNRSAIESGIQQVDQAVAALDGEITQLIARREREVAAEQALAALVNESAAAPALKDERVHKDWEQQRDAMIAQGRKELLAAPGLLERARRLYPVYAAIDEAVRVPLSEPDPNADPAGAAWSKPLAEALTKVVREKQTEHVGQTLTWARSSESGITVEEARQRLADQRLLLTRFLDEAARLIADARTAQAALDAGYAPDEPTPQGPAARKALAAWKGHDLLKHDAIRQSLARLLEHADPPVDRQAPLLLATLTDPSAPLGVRIDAFRALDGDAKFPQSGQQLTALVEQSAQLREQVNQRIVEPPRRQAIVAFMTRSVQDQWSRFTARATEPEDLSAAVSTRAAVGIEPTGLSPTMTFNVALHTLRETLAAGSARRDDIEVLLARLELAYTTLPDSARDQIGKTPLAPAAEAFREFLPIRHFEQTGPAALSTPQQPWTVQLDEAAGTVTYRTRLRGSPRTEPIELVFKRIDGDAQTPPFYLATRETSVELFILAAEITGGWDKLDPLLFPYDASKADPRPGPRSWERAAVPPVAGTGARSEPRRPPILATTYWLSSPPPHYPPALAADEALTLLKDPDGRASKVLNPSFDHPMQYVSPAAALAMARMLGCDLPTPRQWQLAFKAVGIGSPNLRDRVWKLQWLRAAASETTGHLSPDLGIFDATLAEHRKSEPVVTPLGTPRIPGVANATPGATSNADAWTSAALAGREPQEGDRYFDDGALFFRPTLVRPAPFFNHLVGNVAEFVADDEKCYVIGGSALSVPARFDEPREIPNWRDERRGWSDVGFRLALPPVPWPQQQLLAALKQTPYVAAPAR